MINNPLHLPKTLLYSFILFFTVGLISGCGDDEATISEPQVIFQAVPSSESGITFSNKIVETADFNYFIYDCAYQGAGVAVGDINNDGLEDIYFAGNQVPNKLYLNTGGLKFEDITTNAGVEVGEGWSTGVAFVDINSDGFQDLFVSRFLWTNDNEIVKNLVFINNGDLTFTERSKELGLDQPGFTVQHSFLDYDKDGDLDIYVVNQPPCEQRLKKELVGTVNLNFTDRLFRNDGAMFAEVTVSAGITNYGYGLSASVFDYNNDGWPDIYVTNDYEEPDILYLNNKNGTFTNVINQSLGHTSNFSMGSDAADFNNDGYLDVAVVDMVARDNKRLKTNMSGMNPSRFSLLVDSFGFKAQYMFNTLQLNNGNATFSDIGQLAGIDRTDWSWTPLFADFNLDGYKDLFVTNGLKRDIRNNDFNKKGKKLIDENGPIKSDSLASSSSHFMNLLALAPTLKLHDYLFLNNHDLSFRETSVLSGIDKETWAHGAAYADFDNDGDIDLILNSMDDPAVLYQNLSAEKKLGKHLAVRLIGPKGNPHAVGSRIELIGENSRQLIEQCISRGYMSGSTKSIHFGFKKSDVSNLKLLVTWPDGTQSMIDEIEPNGTVQLDYNNVLERSDIPLLPSRESDKLIARISEEESGLNFIHKENLFNDYEREVLLPHKLSVIGPKMALADVNGDGLDDIFVCGAMGQNGQLFIQNISGKFEPKVLDGADGVNNADQTGAVFFDADNDGDQDLFIVAGGNEEEGGSESYRDRLFLNDGYGEFKYSSEAIPPYSTSGSCALPFDFDNDGDLDLYIGGRQVPGKWPVSPRSVVLRNDGGRFYDVTSELGEALEFSGMITDAAWGDIDSDGKNELVLVGEWTPIMVFRFENEKFKASYVSGPLAHATGWWNCVELNDLDGDGNLDMVLGNLGLNIKYKASVNNPFEVYYGDFDSTGTGDIYLGYYENDQLFPVRGRECSSQQMPVIKQRFPTYEQFGEATIKDVLGKAVDDALNLKAKTFATSIAWNNGDSFEVVPLPNEAQISVVNGVEIIDVNSDGKKDIVLAGNYFDREVETVRSDAGTGLVLLGEGNRSFKPLSPKASGFYANGNVRDLAILRFADRKNGIVVANNNSSLELFELLRSASNENPLP